MDCMVLPTFSVREEVSFSRTLDTVLSSVSSAAYILLLLEMFPPQSVSAEGGGNTGFAAYRGAYTSLRPAAGAAVLTFWFAR